MKTTLVTSGNLNKKGQTKPATEKQNKESPPCLIVP